jgi:dolichol-phosphate mannosyltransferase
MVSIVIPVYNERETLSELHRRLTDAVLPTGEPYEILFVNDGSSDGSREVLRSIAGRDTHTRALHLARNFGHQVAISAGIDEARGNAIILMDGDLQDPPELLPDMIARWKAGSDVVYMVKRTRKEHVLKRLLFRSFYELMQKMSTIPIPLEAGNFSLMDRKVVDVVRAMPERNRYIAGMRAWAGFTQTGIEFDRDARFAGSPHMTIPRLFRLAFDGLFSFSNVPLRIAMYAGVVTALFSFAAGIVVLYIRLFTNQATPGWASPVVSILFIGGLILVTLGVIGEYIGRIYDEVKRRPLYVIQERTGFGTDDPPLSPVR